MHPCGHTTTLVPRVVLSFLSRRHLSTQLKAIQVGKNNNNSNNDNNNTNDNINSSKNSIISKNNINNNNNNKKSNDNIKKPRALLSAVHTQNPLSVHSSKNNISENENNNSSYRVKKNKTKTKTTETLEKAETTEKTKRTPPPRRVVPPPPPSPVSPSYEDYRIVHPLITKITQENNTTENNNAKDNNNNEDKYEEERKRNRKVKVFLGVSGGVDSSVSALLLKKQGFDVVGVYMKCWDEKDEFGACMGEKDMRDAEDVCKALDIPFKHVDFVKEYWHEVFTQFLEGFQNGYTPNPDLLCNKKIKFNHFINYCLQNGADLVATGHYARVEHPEEGGVLLKRGKDENKDQTYFLSSLEANQINRVIFPVGTLTKGQVRLIAEENKVAVAKKKNSVGICFVGKRSLPDFLTQYIDSKNGTFKTLDGKHLGIANGYNFYTIGQRPRLSGQTDRMFVCGIDRKRHTVTVCSGHLHPALYSDTCVIKNVVWVNSPPPEILKGEWYKCSYQARYQQMVKTCSVKRDGDEYYVMFDIPAKATTPGQAFVMYNGEVCVGSGIIDVVGRNYHLQRKGLPEHVKQLADFANY